MGYFVIHDIKDPNDPQGRTYKEANLATRHAIPIGTLVELLPAEGDGGANAGVRLYVVAHMRDCDGTPLYGMSADRDDTEVRRPGFANPKWVHGWPEESLRPIDPPLTAG